MFEFFLLAFTIACLMSVQAARVTLSLLSVLHVLLMHMSCFGRK